MKKLNKLFWVCCCIVFLVNSKVTSSKKDKAFDIPNEDPSYFFGQKYEPEPFNADYNPFVFNLISFKGDVCFNSRFFTNVNMMYDIANKKLVVAPKDISGNNHYITLPQHLLSWFTFSWDEETFRFVVNNEKDLIHQDLPTGIFEEIYSNKVKYLLKHDKVHEFNTDGKYQYRYEKKYYLIKADKLFCLEPSNLHKAFNLSHKLYRKKAKAIGIHIKKAENQQLIKLIEYLESNS